MRAILSEHWPTSIADVLVPLVPQIVYSVEPNSAWRLHPPGSGKGAEPVQIAETRIDVNITESSGADPIEYRNHASYREGDTDGDIQLHPLLCRPTLVAGKGPTALSR